MVAAGYPRVLASSVAEKLEKEEGISVEVIDARSLYPIDEDLILESVKKTGRLVTLDDAPLNGSFASEIAALVAEKGYSYLKAPIKRVTRIKVPVPHSKIEEEYVLLNEAKVINAVKDVVNY
ncbi:MULTISPECIES: transketolase C-terminal domain-containing protein [unclassified Petrotoga]|uniref:transketolase C-terminal domain-containing protein n=1 Tax=unclassified Petrotoga TaxID=2620614 RepID=UPI001E5AA726|nr:MULTISPECIES: transketolase C-terminal domain-containing protein [unclassified Petrotoga]